MSEMVSSDESMDEEDILEDFEAEAQLIIQTETLPQKSADRYNLVYETYKKWLTNHQISLSSSAESNLIVYFKQLSQKLKPPTLWSIWSMLKKTLNAKESVDISQFHNLKYMIKNVSKGYRPKKSQVLKWDEIMNFMKNAPDYIYLAAKVILVFGICGALRCSELKNLTIHDVEDRNNEYVISIDNTKNYVPRQLVVGQLFYQQVKQYISLRPEDISTDKFFIQYHKGKCQRQVIGRNKIGEIPQMIASYLNKPNAKLYTGHCFRRTAATLLSESGGNITMLKQLGAWNSTTIAQGYIENSMRNRRKIFDRITHTAVSNDESNPQPSTKVDCDLFAEEFEIIDENLAENNILDQSKLLPPSTSLFTTATNKKILLPSNKQPTLPTHFTAKPPITVFPKKSKNEPPFKKIRTEPTIGAKNRTSASLSTNPSVKKDPCNIYENCIFHGNITNNFYCSCTNFKNPEED